MTLFQRLCRVLLALLVVAILPLAAIASAVHAGLGVVALAVTGVAIYLLYRQVPRPEPEVEAAASSDSTAARSEPATDAGEPATTTTGPAGAVSEPIAVSSGATTVSSGATTASSEPARARVNEHTAAVEDLAAGEPVAAPSPPVAVASPFATPDRTAPGALSAVVPAPPADASPPKPATPAPVRPARAPWTWRGTDLDQSLEVSRRALLVALAIAAIFALAVALRLYRLDDLQGEWYGDISTLYEYVASVREYNFPRDLYNLGVGPAYPLILRPLLAVLGDSYLAIKTSAVIMSLAGLSVLFLLCRRIAGIELAMLATLVAATSSWLLIYSRVGDVQAAVPLFTVGPLALAARVIDSPGPRRVSAALCGLMAGACIYVYGAAFMVPVLTTAVLAAFALRPPGRTAVKRRDLLAYLTALAVAALPMAVAWARAPDAFAQGHFASRLLRGSGAVTTVVGNFFVALMAYVTEGDRGLRGNVPTETHIDRLSLVLLVLGCFYWLRPANRRWGWVVLGGFALMHVPSILVDRLEVPSSGRTISAAPFLFILIAGGIRWLQTAVAKRWGGRASGWLVAAVLATLTLVNAHRYFVRYIGSLPYGNTHIARAITTFVDLLPPGTQVYMVGPPWSPGGMPEPKSIRYNMRHPDAFHEQEIGPLDCARLAELAAPSVLLWTYERTLPSPGVRDCADQLPGQLYVSDRDVPMFHAAALFRARATGEELAPSPLVTETARRPATPSSPATREPSAPSAWGAAGVDLGGVAAEMRFMPTDMGGPENTTDGDTGTVMRGALDNPYLLELRFAEATPIASFSLDLGYMPEYEVTITVTGPDGAVTTVSDHETPEPGSAPRTDLALPNGPLLTSTALISIRDIRDVPAEGWHIHIFELRVDRAAAAGRASARDAER